MRKALRADGRMAHFLEEAAASSEPILLLVNDGHRSTQTAPALAALRELLSDLAIRPQFRALIATGTHQFLRDERSAFEAATFSAACVPILDAVWHDADDAAAHTSVHGIRLHRLVAESRFLLPIGSVEPHYFAGVTGPHKTLTAGCMSREALAANHARALDPACQILRRGGNPVFEGFAGAVESLERQGKRICAIAEVVRGNQVAAAAVGSPLGAVEALMPVMLRLYVQSIEAAADVVHLKVPLPLGRSLYQADKATKNNQQAVRDGGAMILEALCPEGVGPDRFVKLLERSADYAAARRIVDEEGYRLGDHKAVMLRHLTDPARRGVHLTIVSPVLHGMSIPLPGTPTFAEVAAALAWLREIMQGPVERGLIIEDAGLVTVAVA